MDNQLTTLPAIKGINFRFYQGSEDHPALIKHFNRVYEHAESQQLVTKDNFNADFASLRNCNPKEDMILAEADHQIVATARVAWNLEMDGDYIYNTDISTHPDWLNTPLQIAVLDWAINRAEQISAGHPMQSTRFFEEWAFETEGAKIAMLKEYGFEEVRYWYKMFRGLDAPIGNMQLPEGLEIRVVKPEHYRPIWEALNEAFRDHWGHVDGTEEDFQRLLSKIGKIDGYRPELWMVAWDGDQIAGMVLNRIFEAENKALGVKRGWTDPICVRRPWRKRGLATALINKSLAMLKEIGMHQGVLDVDTINPSGALSLYEKCGYVSQQKTITLRKPFTEKHPENTRGKSDV